MTDITDFLRELPKCEHHVHLEGTLEPELLFELAGKNEIQLPTDFPSSVAALYKRYEQFTGLDDFLTFYYLGMNTLISAKDFEALAFRYFEKCAQDGVRHVEVSFDPQAHLSRGVEMDAIVRGVNVARARASKELGLSTKFIMCLLRHLSVESGVDTVKLAKPHLQTQQIDGVGLCSSEQGLNPAQFQQIFDTVREIVRHPKHAEFIWTAHAGEEGPPAYVREALDILKVERIDHGVRAAQDPQLLKDLARDGVMLTTCPVSNLKLRGVSDIAHLPYREFLDHGVVFSINSDDPGYFGASCLGNYFAVQRHFDFDMATWVTICRRVIECTRLENELRETLLNDLENVRAKYIAV